MTFTIEPADPYDLERFVTAQNAVYAKIGAELDAGEKRSHWIWFIFPQLSALGQSTMAHRYGIGDANVARAYLQNTVLAARLQECCTKVLSIQNKTALQIFGHPDDLKLRSSMTLFSSVAPEQQIFAQVLDKYFNGETDKVTLRLLNQ